MRDFKKLVVWQRAHAFTVAIHEAVRHVPRGSEYTFLKGQLTRAAGSIATNIVEGCGAASQREFARYLDIAIKSATETEYHVLSARDRAALPPDRWHPLTSELVEIRRMTYALRKRILGDD